MSNISLYLVSLQVDYTALIGYRVPDVINRLVTLKEAGNNM